MAIHDLVVSGGGLLDATKAGAGILGAPHIFSLR